MLIPEKRRARNILQSKSKRLLIDSEDAKELTLSWEEAQQLLRPPLSGKSTVVMVENHAFEEYDVLKNVYPQQNKQKGIVTSRIACVYK
ncbi:hypothetical protein LguiA_021295 [Lonicera macranthoides]